MSKSTTVITIDGPAGAGKSTVAKCIAEALGYSYLDTGAMYRALTLKALQHNLEMNNEDQLVALAKKTHVDVKDGKVSLDGKDVSEAIRLIEITNNSFYVAQAPRVREVLVQWQRNASQNRSIVVEGRDVGTVVFPKATYKFYLDANLEERSKRRVKELRKKFCGCGNTFSASSTIAVLVLPISVMIQWRLK